MPKVNFTFSSTNSLQLTLLLLFFQITFYSKHLQGQERIDILIVGGGASGCAAAIQAGKLQAKVILVEEGTWLGGMLTSSGVSAIDGNHNLPSGIWGEFRERIYKHYGGAQNVSTGWVSNTLFEPHIGNKIFKEWIREFSSVNAMFETSVKKIQWNQNVWSVDLIRHGKVASLTAKFIIDATELGDVSAQLGYPYFIGMDDQQRFKEDEAPLVSNDIIQDLTYVAILKDYGKGTDKRIQRPKDYNPAIFDCACTHADPITTQKAIIDCEKMLDYGKLPNRKYMINWPNCGNDFYLNIIEANKNNRLASIHQAKERTFEFIYYLQNDLGYRNLGLADDEFPTEDLLPIIPYYRESRRFISETMLSLPYVKAPYNQPYRFYQTGIAVGDYPIDHHHKKNLAAPTIDFLKIRVPSYNIPLGSLIPKGSTNLIVAEKSIGVSNIVNGATRLQPVVLGIGQGAGAIAAIAAQQNQNLQTLNIREVQQTLLNHNAYIMPFVDIDLKNKHFKAIQRIGATGIIKGTGVPYKWANQTWFYPDQSISEYELVEGLRNLYPQMTNFWEASGNPLTIAFLQHILKELNNQITYEDIQKIWSANDLGVISGTNQPLNRVQASVLIDAILKPFEIAIDFNGMPKHY